jgi:hypothetical protein
MDTLLRCECGAPCPDHGHPCAAIPTPPDMEGFAELFGASDEWEGHAHLCVDGGEPHAWRDP